MRWALIAAFSLCLAISSAVHANGDACGHCDGIADWFERLGCVQQCLSEQNEASPLLPPAPSDDDAVATPESAPTPECTRFDTARLSPGARDLFDFACAHHLTYQLDYSSRSWSYWDLAWYMVDEDGTVPLIRSGYEVALYRRLKHRLMNREVMPRLRREEVFTEALHAMTEVLRGPNGTEQVSVSVPAALLTAHNVTRLLARPEQWLHDFPRTPYGQVRSADDLAWPILLDLTSLRSVDAYPSLYQYAGWRTEFPLARDLTELFYGVPGVFQFFGEANRADDGALPSHWNGGMHYYYWIGALGHWLAESVLTSLYGFYGVEAAKAYEYLQKGLAGETERASVQIGLGFDQGAALGYDLFNALIEIRSAYPPMIR
jgi:hypothetical protein